MMDELFGAYGHGFRFYSVSHIIPLLIVMTAVFLLFVFRKQLRANSFSDRFLRSFLCVLVVAAMGVKLLWILGLGRFDFRYTLPLQLCDISFLLVFFLCLFPGQYLVEFMYFIGIGGALQALATPALGYDFPHITYLFFFTEHTTVILSALYFVVVRQYRMKPASLLRAFFFFNGTGIAILLVNVILNSNYMFLMQKPAFPSLFDILGPWPVYLAASEIIALIVFALLYLPFFFHVLPGYRRTLQ